MPIYKMDGKKNGYQKYRVRINYTDQHGKSKQLDRVAYGKEAAKDLEYKLSQELKTGELNTCKMTLKELFDEYVKVKSYELRESTIEKSRRKLNMYVIPQLGDLKLEKLNTKTLQEWKLDIERLKTSKNKSFSTGYKRKIYSEFRALLNYAVKMEYIKKNYLSIVGNFKEEISDENESMN